MGWCWRSTAACMANSASGICECTSRAKYVRFFTNLKQFNAWFHVYIFAVRYIILYFKAAYLCCSRLGRPCPTMDPTEANSWSSSSCGTTRHDSCTYDFTASTSCVSCPCHDFAPTGMSSLFLSSNLLQIILWSVRLLRRVFQKYVESYELLKCPSYVHVHIYLLWTDDGS